MRDGSIATLEEAVRHHNQSGTPNPYLSKMIRSLNLTDEEVDTLVALMKALDGEGFME
jgi:cytochrome c peroxidase